MVSIQPKATDSIMKRVIISVGYEPKTFRKLPEKLDAQSLMPFMPINSGAELNGSVEMVWPI
jgi:hypothetical protein